MGWQDRDYNRQGFGAARFDNPLLSLLFGSVPLGTFFGIRVRVHASLIWLVGLSLLFGYTQGYPLHYRAVSMAALFAIILLHEFGHCFAARWVGGTADDILMWPLGGLAYANAPRRPWPTFVTVAGGPMVNVIICIICGVWLYFDLGVVQLNPFEPLPRTLLRVSDVSLYVWWISYTSYVLLLFNLLPIYPLDGGQLLQSILWPIMGYFRSMMVAFTTGMVGAVFLAAYGLFGRSFILVIVAVNGFLVCYQKRLFLRHAGPEELLDEPDYSASFRPDPPPRRRLSKRFVRRAQRQLEKERQEQARVDAILEKVSMHGMHSLSWWERRALRRATERQRQREMELTRNRGW